MRREIFRSGIGGLSLSQIKGVRGMNNGIGVTEEAKRKPVSRSGIVVNPLNLIRKGVWGSYAVHAGFPILIC